MKSIFSRLILSYIVIILIAILTIGFFFSGLLRSYMIDQKEMELRQKGSKIAEISREFLVGNIGESTFSYVLGSIDDVVNSRTLIIDRSSIIVNSPFPFKNPRDSYLKKGAKITDKDLLQILNGSTVIKSGYISLFNEPMITVGIPVFLGGEKSYILGAVILNSPVEGVTEATDKTITMLILAGLGALAFSLVAAYVLSKTISKPIHTISKAALEIADGDYSKKVNINREDEIGNLASAFNYLTHKLNSTIGDLNNERSKLSDILYSMEEGMIAVDNRLNIIHVNPAALQLLGMDNTSNASLFQIANIGDIAANVTEVLNDGESKSYKYNISENKVLNILISPLKYQNDIVYGAIILLQDISQSVKLEKMRRDFVANVSHELRTPLTSIRGFIEPLIDGTVDDDATKLKYNKIIRSETLRLERLINDLLDLSRFQAGKVVLDIQKVDIIELISNVSSKFQPIFNSRIIRFKFNKPEHSVFIKADGDRIEQVLIIFIDNAVKYTPEGGEIEISLVEEGQHVKIAIKDSGIGIPEEDILYIWDRFYKVDKSRTGKSTGTGLGLSIAKNIIELHSQKVSVKSKVGKGTIFEFTMERDS